MEDFAKKLLDTVDELNATRKGNCWICQRDVQNWAVIIPENPDGLGFGNEGTKTRVMFIPICEWHDRNDEENIKLIRDRIKIKRMEMLN